MRFSLADIFLPQDQLPEGQRSQTPRQQRKSRPEGLSILENVPLARYTRFEVGGPARILADAANEAALREVLAAIEESGEQYAIIGGGTNLVAGDQGYPGVVVRYTNAALEFAGDTVQVAAGAVLQDLVDASVARGLKGLETMTGIPGWVGGAVYGNAGAYGHSIQERATGVRFLERGCVREISNADCEFAYRESRFKRRKDWVILSVTLQLESADAEELRASSEGILKIRNEKYPPSMRCAGSIFKNLLWRDLPEAVRAQVPAAVVREGKVPSAYFLEQAGAKGMSRGRVRVADYHANLIYNEGGGTAQEVVELITELKRRVHDRFGMDLEEEVQFL
jgi:UDP-N-acetylmuramate dehydrogenase